MGPYRRRKSLCGREAVLTVEIDALPHGRTNGIGMIETTRYKNDYGKRVVLSCKRKELIVKFPDQKPIVGSAAVVGTTRGLTLNIGDYEFARIDVTLNVPCNPDEVDTTYENVEAWVDAKIETQRKSIRQATK